MSSAKNVTQNVDLIFLGKLFIYRHDFPVRTPSFHESRYSILYEITHLQSQNTWRAGNVPTRTGTSCGDNKICFFRSIIALTF